ncbi:hypothetical protein [Terriglobus saanensis]|uniref:Transmembrane anti-sigma factor n=1 Tax=Terriglobus saanensis (strain ATCC BAA-1853 / DSM 23119 / SP1PR4) TaxID=401053 RepID=E8V535_TERSS|nr:hypothetical protein [Terriglobus saanensis]ADV83722.1 hypothetical protein AciPR4_2962 [Terriglobus saanensis SP1PR4]
MDCKKYETEILDLIDAPSGPNGAPLADHAAARHIAGCPECLTELNGMRATFAAMSDWTAPEISPWFDGKLAARLREAQQAQPEGFFARLRSRFLFTSNLQLRPIMAGAMAIMLAVGGGGYASFVHLHPSVQASATVQDLQLLDTDATALQQIDQLVDDNSTDDGNDSAS